MRRRGFGAGGRALREDDGFTLIELLVGCSIGVLVLVGGINVMDSTLRISRTHAGARRHRPARAHRDGGLHARPALAGLPERDGAVADRRRRTRTSSTTRTSGTVDTNPEKHEISLESGDIVMRRWVGTGTPPSMTWPGTPTSTRTVLENVATYGGTPFLRYYAWQNGNPVLPTTLLAAPLSAANLAAAGEDRRLVPRVPGA